MKETLADLLESNIPVQIKNVILVQENGNTSLDKCHDYYIQVQGQLLVTSAS